MNPEQQTRLKRLFLGAYTLPPHERAAYLGSACPDDPDLRREVDSLLASHDEAEARGFLDSPQIGIDQLALPEDEEPIQQIGPYRIHHELGRGGMGVVYLAEREDVGKRVAIKVVHRYLASSDVVARFLFERRILARLEHPHIARLLDAGTMEDGTPFLAMEYVEGEPLIAYCDDRRMSLPGRLALFEKVCEAVRYAHQNLIIHRDLKPSNILVHEGEGTPQVKLLDFGIAKLVEQEAESPALTRAGSRAMTPAYAAPEQVRGEPVTTATDVYSLGMLLYELLVGQRPYEVRSTSPSEVERVVCELLPARPSSAVGRVKQRVREDGTTEPTTPEAVSRARSTEPARLRKTLRGDLDVICLKALAKEPSLRYPSAEAMLEDLRRHRAGLPVEARPATPGYRIRKFVSRHRAGVAVAGVAVTLIAVLTGIYTWRLAAERDRVAEELARSETVTTFLMDLFEAGDPFTALGDTLTVYDLLSRGVERAESLSSEPRVQAQMLDLIGRIYDQMGEYERAQPLLERALERRREILGPAHPDVAQSLDRLATLLRMAGDYDAAEPLVREALAMRRTSLGEDHLEVASSLNSLGTLLQFQGDYEGAEPLFRQVLAMRRKLQGEDHFDTVTSMNNLGLLLQLKGQYEEAESLYREVVAIDRATLGQAHPAMAIDIHNLASLLADRGEFEEAEALGREALAMHRATLGDEHPLVATDLKSLSNLFVRGGRYEEAERLLHQALDIDRAKRGATHSHTITDQKSLGVLRFLQGDLEEAERLLRQSLSLYPEQLGPKHPLVANAMVALGDVLAARGDTAGVQALYEEALAMQQELLPEEHRDIAANLRSQGQLKTASGNFAAAERLLLQALDLQRRQLSSLHPDVAGTLTRLAEVHTARGDRPAAVSFYREALTIYRDRLGEAHAWVLEVERAMQGLTAGEQGL